MDQRFPLLSPSEGSYKWHSVRGADNKHRLPTSTVLSPLLFSLFTNDFAINNDRVKLIKYADDMALVGLCQKNDPSSEGTYLAHVKAFELWFKYSQLEINVSKTKELLFSKKQDLTMEAVSLSNQCVETVQTFKYLGTLLDWQLSFSDNTEYVFKKCSQRLSLLRRLSNLGVGTQILELVYTTHIESILTFHLPAWFSHLSSKCKTKLNRVVSIASKIVGKPQKQLTNLYTDRLKRKARRIVADATHPLCNQFELLKSGKRYRVPLAKGIFRKSFIPNAINILNSK